MDFDTLLTQMASQRPELKDSLTMMREFQKKQSEEKNDPAVDGRTDAEHIKELEALIEQQKNVNRNLLKQFEHIKDNYGMLLGQIDEMANATGACPECWGEDGSCKYCRGRGKPGYYLPDPQLFEVYIKPVIQKLKENKPPVNN
jgi:hypothetical protein